AGRREVGGAQRYRGSWVMPMEGRRFTFIKFPKEERRGDCREARNTQQDPRPPAGTISQGQEGHSHALR
ncbi:MAG: hypothetical protein V3W08_00880, partial [Candidatus Binatia bacterium]